MCRQQYGMEEMPQLSLSTSAPRRQQGPQTEDYCVSVLFAYPGQQVLPTSFLELISTLQMPRSNRLRAIGVDQSIQMRESQIYCIQLGLWGPF